MDDSERKNDLSLAAPMLEAVDDGMSGDMSFASGLNGGNAEELAGRLSLLETSLSLLTRDMGFKEFCRELLVGLMKVIPCEASSILEVNHEEGIVFFRVASGHSSDRVVNFVIPLGRGLVGQVIQSRRSLLISNVSENNTHLREVATAVGFEVRDMIAAPIIIRGNVHGVVELLNKAGEAGFTPDDQEKLDRMCLILARVLEVRMMLSWMKKNKDTSGVAA